MKTWDLNPFSVSTKADFVAEYLGLSLCDNVNTVSGYLFYIGSNFNNVSSDCN